MARPLGIEYPGALYYVISHGSEQRPIVLDDADRSRRLEWLRRTLQTYGWRLHAPTLMTTPEHLFVETPAEGRGGHAFDLAVATARPAFRSAYNHINI
jgi:hypothetical protein